MDGLAAADRFDGISMAVIDHAATKAEALALEKKYIAYYLAQSYILVNTIDNPRGQALNQQLKEAWIAGGEGDEGGSVQGQGIAGDYTTLQLQDARHTYLSEDALRRCVVGLDDDGC
jgi:hypothetical protein